MKAMRLHAPMDFREDDIPMPTCGHDDVKIRVACCGICGSDRPRGLDGDVPFFPNTLGHEFSGIVDEVGEHVTSVRPGDLVAGAPLIVCNECEPCKLGNFGSCANSKFVGLRVKDVGGFAQYIVLPESNVIPCPKDMDPLAAAFIEPIGVAIHALFRSEMRGGSNIAVVGCGTIGLFIIACAKLMGAAKVFAFDISEDALKAAKRYGADYVYHTKDENKIEKYLQDCGGYGCPYVMEAVGLQDTVNLSFDVAKAKANIVMAGNLGVPITFSREYMRKLLKNELNWKGTWMQYDPVFPGDAWRLAIDFIYSNKIDVKSLIYKIADITQVHELFEEWKVPGKVKGKMIVTMDSWNK